MTKQMAKVAVLNKQIVCDYMTVKFFLKEQIIGKFGHKTCFLWTMDNHRFDWKWQREKWEIFEETLLVYFD